MGSLKWPILIPRHADVSVREAADKVDVWDVDDYPEGGFLGTLANWCAENWGSISLDAEARLCEWVEANLANADAEVAARFAAEYLAPLARLAQGSTVTLMRRCLGFLGRLYLAAADEADGRDASWFWLPISASSPMPPPSADAASVVARTDPRWNIVTMVDARHCESVDDVHTEFARQLPMAVATRRGPDLMAASIAVGLLRLRAPEVTVWIRPPEVEIARRESLSILDLVRQSTAAVADAFSDRFTIEVLLAS